MCTVSIKVDESVIRSINPALTSNESIELWLQNQVDFMIQDMVGQDTETMDLETAREKLHSMIRNEYAL
ncbi:MAG: hypothetical protein IJ911_05600 [Salinivirgaceae bacterium]|nr:hypothetical protein [Salinivirgaceae bacterium]